MTEAARVTSNHRCKSLFALTSTVSLTALALIATAPGALAQDADVVDDGTLEQIFVTARKRGELLQDVPFSLAAQTEEKIRNSGAQNLEELSYNVAGFTVQNLGPGQSQVAIRGVAAGQIVRDQPGVKEQVGVYLDESVISLSLFTPDMDLFDLNRVEVLRGPQGTLFGSGSIGGTVRYITNEPNLEDMEFTAQGTGRLVDGGDFGGDIRAMVNVPVAEGAVAIRAVGFYSALNGFIDAIQPGGTVNDDVNDGERLGFRVAVQVQPTDSLTITPRIVYQDIEIDGFNRTDVFNILANPFTTTRPAITIGERQQFTQREENFTDEFLLFDATIELEMGDVTFTSVSSYTDREILQIRDATQLTGSITGQPGVLSAVGLPESVFTITSPLDDATDVQMFTQEARVASNDDGPFQWVLGVFYSDIDRDYGQTLNVPGFEAAANDILNAENPVDPGDPLAFPDGWTVGVIAEINQLFVSRIPYQFEQVAIFGEASYDLTERLNITGGIRWFDFQEDRILNFDGIFAAQTIGLEGTTSSSGVSPRVIVSYDVNENVRINAQASRGFRLGGINDPLNIPLCTPEDLITFGGFDTWDDETLWNYEVGAKTSFAGGRGTFNVAAFFADIKNLQATLTAGSCSSRIIFNVPKARSLGVEAELTMRVNDNFDFAVSGSLIDSEFRSDVTSTAADGTVSVLAGIESGARLPTVPRFQMAASGTYTRPVANTFDGFITGTVVHVGSRFTQSGDVDLGTVDLTVIPIGAPSVDTFTFDPRLPAYTIGNIRFGVRNDRWEFALFVNNVWDEVARLALDQERGTLARVGFLNNQPRTFGFNVRFIM